MHISGSLADVSVSEVMQFIHLGRRSGTLVLTKGEDQATVIFHLGRLVSSQAPRTPKVGTLLIDNGHITKRVLETAIARQKRETKPQSLGQILISLGAIRQDVLREVITRQIKKAVAEIVQWKSGIFDFATDDFRPIDDICFFPSEVLPDTHLNTQMVLAEAARIFEDRSESTVARERAVRLANPNEAATPDTPPPSEHPQIVEPDELLLTAREMQQALDFIDKETPRPAHKPVEIQVVSRDDYFVQSLQETLASELITVEQTVFDQTGQPRAGNPAPIVLLDLRRSEIQPSQISELHKNHPNASLIGIVGQGSDFGQLYAVGVVACVPSATEMIEACLKNVISIRRDLQDRGINDTLDSGIARMRRVVGDLRSGLISATMALTLMHIISESFERAVLFLVKADYMLVLGAFGTDSHNRHLAELTRGLRIKPDPESAISRCMHSGAVQVVAFDDANLPLLFRNLVGKPHTGEIALFPVMGAARAIAVVYADNGGTEKLVEDIDLLEIATAQVGVAFELELLHRQLTPNKPS